MWSRDSGAGLILWDKSQEEQKLVTPVTSDVTGAALTNLREVAQPRS